MTGLSLDHYFDKLGSGHAGHSHGPRDREEDMSMP
jgi:hypothetical protein